MPKNATPSSRRFSVPDLVSGSHSTTGGPQGLRQCASCLAKLPSADIIHVDLEYMLDTSHGADYFRRWHRNKDVSGGLLVHKTTHHFDLVNWWTDSVPETVFGVGRLAFYGRENAHALLDVLFPKQISQVWGIE